MQRVLQLVSAVRSAHPNDTFFLDLERSLATWPLKRRFYTRFERAFSRLDDKSWKNLVEKAVAHFHETRPHQLKGPFFDQLNDAFAYKWLIKQGFHTVRILRETSSKKGAKQPDISFRHGNTCFYCETKTINTSLDELRARVAGGYRDFSKYRSIHPTLFKKYDDAIRLGSEQIHSNNARGIVFVVSWPDDFTMTYHNEHRQVIRTYLRTQNHPVVVQFGLTSSFIQHLRSLLRKELRC